MSPRLSPIPAPATNEAEKDGGGNPVPSKPTASDWKNGDARRRPYRVAPDHPAAAVRQLALPLRAQEKMTPAGFSRRGFCLEEAQRPALGQGAGAQERASKAAVASPIES
jgi:hypothetical protein